MKLYITFGQQHAHRINNLTIDKNCILEIECKDFNNGRKIAFDLFGPKFSMCYTENELTDHMKSFFPRGIIKLEK